MFNSEEVKQPNIVALYKGGRLPAWHRLTADERRAFEQTHVDLMLTVARERKLRPMGHSNEGVRGAEINAPPDSKGISLKVREACRQKVW